MPVLFSLLGPLLLFMLFSTSSLQAAELEEILDFLLRMILFLLVLIPGIVPSIVASYSFVGEKVNRSIEPLLATPTTDGELLLGKMLATFIATMMGSYVAFAINIVAIDLILFPILGRLYAPDLSWIIVMLLLAPAISCAAKEANVIVSSRMTDIRAAQQVGGLVVMPLMLFLLSSLTNSFPFTPSNLLIISIFVWGVAYLLFRVARSLFVREKILTEWR